MSMALQGNTATLVLQKTCTPDKMSSVSCREYMSSVLMMSLQSCLCFLGCLCMANQEKSNCTYREEVMLGSSTGSGPGEKGSF